MGIWALVTRNFGVCYWLWKLCVAGEEKTGLQFILLAARQKYSCLKEGEQCTSDWFLLK